MRIGIDIGGTKTALAAVDASGAVRASRRFPTPHADYGAALDALAAATLELEREVGERSRVGIGLPGTLSPGGRVLNAFATPYQGMPLRADLERRLQRELRFDNDANCFALSEVRGGAADGAAVAFGAILGTGAGAGIVVDGRLLRGARAAAGEWGHNPLPWAQADELPGPECYCGRRGCIERYVSGPALCADHERATGVRALPEKIVAGALAGDAACERSLARYESRLARALAHVVNLIDPGVIVLGGGLARIGRLYASVPALWAPYLYVKGAAPRLLPAAHGDLSGARGAACLWEA